MWIVKVALQRPYTFIVLALVLLIFGTVTILRTATDIFPNIGIPVVSVVWSYGGLPPQRMGDIIVSNFERAVTTTVNDVEHIESQSLTGMGVVKVFFQPSVNIDVALSQVTAIAQTILRQLPPGATPPLILSYNASSVPVLQLALSSDKLAEQQLFDLGNTVIRTQLATVQGAAIPWPYGGKQRQVQVDIDPRALLAKGLSPQDVNAAIGAQNLILPTGTEKIGMNEYTVELNDSPSVVDQINDLPIKAVNGTMIYVRDVAHVRDGYAPQTNIVRMDGHRAALMTIQKSGNASTLDIIRRVKAALPFIRSMLPPELTVRPIADQSLFVSAAIQGVIREAVIAAALTGLMILLFLGSWRSTLIITISIPLAILASIIVLSALGQTINIMTLGGLALAVGILVDDATVTIENINWHLERGKPVAEAILDGAQQIATPALVSTLCICIVFVPMFFLTGVARYLFVPLGEAVVFAMLASYGLSRTLVPTLAKFWLRAHHPGSQAYTLGRNLAGRAQAAFERGFERARRTYRVLLAIALINRRIFVLGSLGLMAASLLLIPALGEDFFPTVDGGQIKLHLRAHPGTRIEETARLCDQVEAFIRDRIPAEEIATMVDNIGLPVSGINLSYSNSAPTGPADADILISLAEGHRPTADWVRALRLALPRAFPGVNFAFLPADIVNQVLNFGLPAPIDIQVMGQNLDADRRYAEEVYQRLKHVPGIVDLRLQQTFDNPELTVTVDRSRAEELGYTQRNIANNLLVSLSGSGQTTPNFWVNPRNGVAYAVVTQTPQYRMDTLQALKDLPLTAAAGHPPQILGALARIGRATGPVVASHYNTQPILDLFAGVQGADLGSVAAQVRRILADTKGDVPRGSKVMARGQMQTMAKSFAGLYSGLALAVVLIYLLIVVNFQSWLDPFIIITALPAALAGIVWMLFATHTTLSVPALTGAIMCMGVATANSILVVSFARERMAFGREPLTAALEAGYARFRPVLMTALAMIIGMVPMALGLGEGGEQNAPLGRAVIGGLLCATGATLFFVPAVFCLVHGRRASGRQR